jgi:hypothetical protein
VPELAQRLLGPFQAPVRRGRLDRLVGQRPHRPWRLAWVTTSPTLNPQPSTLGYEDQATDSSRGGRVRTAGDFEGVGGWMEAEPHALVTLDVPVR